MNDSTHQINESAVLGQKHAFAAASLLLGIASFISLLGLEKGLLAVVFGVLALKANPLPLLAKRRAWARTGLGLGVAHIVLVLGLVIVGWRVVLALAAYATDLGNALFHGPKTVLSIPSPNTEFTAYVEDLPSIDPPNQALFVERKDQRHFMHVGNLAEDVDAIQEVLWSPDSRVVVFHSRDYLTAVRVADWQTVRVFLGEEWTRHQAGRRSTFSSGDQRRSVTTIQFDGPDSVSYRFKDDERLHRLDFSPSH
jgi:hypothetical protein